MDDAERGRRGPESFSARAPKAPPVSRRIAIPRWEVPSDPSGWLINFLLLVLLCIVVMGIAAVALRQWGPSAASATPSIVIAGAPFATAASTPQRPATSSLADATDAIEREAREKAQLQADERRESAYRARLAEEEAARRALALEARREREWHAYYKKPPACDESLPEIDSVNCANEFIRQRRTFEEQFSARTRAGG